jgi:hypothetical protein
LTDDPFEQYFAALDPVRELSDAQLEALHPTSRLLDRLRDDIAGSPSTIRRKPPWRRTVVASVVVAVAFAGTAAALTILRAPVRETTTLSCFSRDALNSRADVVSYDRYPLDTCKTFMNWSHKSGSHSLGFLCVLSNGSLAGFPPEGNGSTCSTLQLPAFNGHIANPNASAFQQATTHYFSENPCVPRSVAQREVQRLIGEYAVPNWHVVVSGSPNSSSCATLAIEARSRVIDIVAIAK